MRLKWPQKEHARLLMHSEAGLDGANNALHIYVALWWAPHSHKLFAHGNDRLSLVLPAAWLPT